MKNFNTSYAIISGLNHSSIQRLSKTWKVSKLKKASASLYINLYFQKGFTSWCSK